MTSQIDFSILGQMMVNAKGYVALPEVKTGEFVLLAPISGMSTLHFGSKPNSFSAGKIAIYGAGICTWLQSDTPVAIYLWVVQAKGQPLPVQMVCACPEDFAAQGTPPFDIDAGVVGRCLGRVLEKDKKNAGHAYLRRVLSTLHSRYAESLTLDMLAAEMHISKHKLIKDFKQVYNTTPIDMLNRIRIQKSADLLTSTNKTITQIAEITGYNSNAYFSYSFKRTFGITPLTYRNLTAGQL